MPQLFSRKELQVLVFSVVLVPEREINSKIKYKNVQQY